MTGRLRAALASLFLILGIGAAAAEDPEYLTQYKLYNQALQVGDAEAAAEHAKAAWIAAETELGDDRLTAILAFNYGRMIFLSDPKNALAPLRRTNELAPLADGAIPVVELQFLIAFAEAVQSGFARRDEKALREAVDAFEQQNGGASVETAAARLQLALKSVNAKHLRKALRDGETAEAAILSAAPHDYKSLGQAILVQAAAKIGLNRQSTVTRHSTQKLHEIYADLLRAQKPFPPQESFDAFDDTLAQIIAWRSATGALLQSHSRKLTPENEAAIEELNPILAKEIKTAEECNIEWIRKPPNYPIPAEDEGYVGALFAVYDLNADGQVENIRILSEVPQEIFSKATIEAMEKWRSKSTPLDHPACREDLIVHVKFIF